MFFDYLGEEDWTTYECDSCGYQEDEQILIGSYPCPKCADGQMLP